MWGNNKKSEATEVPPPAAPATPAAVPAATNLNSSSSPKSDPIKPNTATVEGKSMSTDAMRPLTTSPAGATARLGPSLHVKGEISGSEDLHVDGSVEGLINLEERKLTVGPSA